MSTLINNFFQSLEEGNVLKNQRLQSGIQPVFPFSEPSFILYANIGYLAIIAVLYLFMKDRQAGFNLKPVIAVYNAICVFLAGWVVYGILRYKIFHEPGFVCNPHNLDTTGPHRDVAFYFWLFYIQKYWEFMDTFFFLLRKSFRQVTFLHVFHHTSITVVVGGLIPYDWNGDMFLPILLNGIVHVLMYSHYLVTALGIRSWWRQYLTSLQLIQFLLISFQALVGAYYGKECNHLFINYTMVLYMISMLVLFGQFFIKNYIKKDTPKKRQ